MVLGVLKKRFEEAKFDGWEGYALLNFPEGEDPRDDCFERLKATIDTVPAALRERAEQFLAVIAAWFDEIMKDLSADVGWGFFPENAAAFITTLIGNLESSSPETTRRWRSEPETEEVGFCEPLASK